MKNIGEKFKQAREYIGISVTEASNDMNVTEAQLENLEDGNANAFKDVFFLKDLIRKYAKYLNLDSDELIEEYNDFMFNFTSRISVSEIEKKVEEIKKEEEKEKKVSSPYTKLVKKEKNKNYKLIFTIIIVTLVLFVIVGAVLLVNSKKRSNDFIGFNLMKGEYYECTK